jgi:hypothetical protein
MWTVLMLASLIFLVVAGVSLMLGLLVSFAVLAYSWAEVWFESRVDRETNKWP